MTDHYVSLSAGIPEVQDHIVAICSDIVKRYDVDGIHLDYIRYSGPKYSYDKPSVERFTKLHGKSPIEMPQEYAQFRRDQVTSIVRKVSGAVKAVKPEVRLSVAALRIYSRAYGLYFQDARGWLRDGLVDEVFNMLYVPDIDTFSSILVDGVKAVPGKLLYPGIGVMNLSPEKLAEQIHRTRELGSKGFALFSYQRLFPVVYQPDSSASAPRSQQLQKALLDGPLKEKARMAK
jgi:uncharacterized lipoprotein YddW (UPF0748 family)